MIILKFVEWFKFFLAKFFFLFEMRTLNLTSVKIKLCTLFVSTDKLSLITAPKTCSPTHVAIIVTLLLFECVFVFVYIWFQLSNKKYVLYTSSDILNINRKFYFNFLCVFERYTEKLTSAVFCVLILILTMMMIFFFFCLFLLLNKAF